MAFDPYDKNSWYFGPMGRKEAEAILNLEDELGVFLVRDSTTLTGDLVLCVKEDTKISHYIINKILSSVSVSNDAIRNQSVVPSNQVSNSPALATTTTRVRFRIGDNFFPDIPALLTFYKNTELDTTKLIRPVKKAEQVIALFDFAGRDLGDLPFSKDEVLTIVKKHEEQWWMAKNSSGQIGCIPVPYVSPYESPLQWSSSFDGSTTSLASFTDANGPLLVRTTSSVNPTTAAIANTIDNNHHSNGIHNNNNNNNNENLVCKINNGDLINNTNGTSSGSSNIRNSQKSPVNDFSNGSDIHFIKSEVQPNFVKRSSSKVQNSSNGNINKNGCSTGVVNTSIDADAVSDVTDSASSVNCISDKVSTLHFNDTNSHGDSVQENSTLTSTLNSRGPPPFPASHNVKDMPSPASSVSSLGSHGSSNFSSTCIPTTLPCALPSSKVTVASANIHSTSSTSSLPFNTSLNTTTTTVHGSTNGATDPTHNRTLNIEGRKLPAKARVIQRHTPNAYDPTALKLEVSYYFLLFFFLFFTWIELSFSCSLRSSCFFFLVFFTSTRQDLLIVKGHPFTIISSTHALTSCFL